jgi:hypothetical protein
MSNLTITSAMTATLGSQHAIGMSNWCLSDWQCLDARLLLGVCMRAAGGNHANCCIRCGGWIYGVFWAFRSLFCLRIRLSLVNPRVLPLTSASTWQRDFASDMQSQWLCILSLSWSLKCSKRLFVHLMHLLLSVCVCRGAGLCDGQDECVILRLIFLRLSSLG